MRINVTVPDRVTRLMLGILLLGLLGVLEGPWGYVALVGLIPLGTALTGFCPFYAAVGWNGGASRKEIKHDH